MRRILAIILSLALTMSVVMLAGCSKKDDTTETEATETEATETEATEALTAASTEADTLPEEETSDGKVTEQTQPDKPADNAPVSTDSLVVDRFHYKDEAVEYAVPQIMLPGDNIEGINDEIYKDYYLRGTKEAEHRKNGFDAGLIRVGYDWTVYKETISLCIDCRYDAGGSQSFSVYNVDQTTGENRSDSFVFGLFGYTEKTFYAAIKKALEDAHCKTNGDTPVEEYKEYWNDALTKTLSDDNVKTAIPHINNKNELCAVIRAYSFAGPPMCYYDIKLSDFNH